MTVWTGGQVERSYAIDHILVDSRVQETPLARRVFERWEGEPPRVVDDVDAAIEQARRRPDALTRGKRTLLLTRRNGPFLTPCQGMTERHVACCGYAILNVVENCPMDCSYCILQAYLDNPFVVAFANLDGLRDEIAQALSRLRTGLQDGVPAAPSALSPQPSPGGRLLRLGTGELGDSLALDRLTGLSLDVMRAVEPFEDVVLELKTKTVEIENLLAVPAQSNVMVSWSLNPPRPIATEEIGAPSLESRLEAARRCQEHGYALGFHFDPLIHSPEWEGEYGGVVRALFERIDPARVAYISLGGLRYPPALAPIVESRFPASTVGCGEMVRSWDGKMRYFRPIRVAMYRRMVQWIRERAPGATVYLCMESPQVWEDVFGWAAQQVKQVAERLDAGCRKTGLAGRAMCAGGGSA